MTDNVSAPWTGDSFGTDNIGGVNFPRNKLIVGADGTNDGDVCKTNGLPVSGNEAADGSGTEHRLLLDTSGNQMVQAAGTKVSAATIPTGGVGFLGWLSAIWYQLTQVLTCAASQSNDVIYVGGVAQTPVTVAIDTASSGDTTVVSGVSAKKIRVLDFALYAKGTANNVYFHDSSVSPVMVFGSATNPITLDKTGSTGPRAIVSGYSPLGKMVQCTTAKDLVVNLSAAQGVTGFVTYIIA